MCTIERFRSRPEEVEAVRFDGRNGAEVVAWVRSLDGSARIDHAGDIVLGPSRREQLVQPGAVVVRRVEQRTFVALRSVDLDARFEALEMEPTAG